MTKMCLPFEARHDPRRLRPAIIVALAMAILGLAIPIIIARFSEVPLATHLPLLVGVSGGLVLLGGLLTSLGITRLRDPVYLAVGTDGRGRWRPFIRVKSCRFPLEPPLMQDGKLIWVDKPHGCGAAVNPDGTYHIDLPKSVSIECL